MLLLKGEDLIPEHLVCRITEQDSSGDAGGGTSPGG